MAAAYLWWELTTSMGGASIRRSSPAVIFAAIIGALTHLLIMRPLRQAAPLMRVIATLGLLIFAPGDRGPALRVDAEVHRPELPNEAVKIHGTNRHRRRSPHPARHRGGGSRPLCGLCTATRASGSRRRPSPRTSARHLRSAVARRDRDAQLALAAAWPAWRRFSRPDRHPAAGRTHQPPAGRGPRLRSSRSSSRSRSRLRPGSSSASPRPR